MGESLDKQQVSAVFFSFCAEVVKPFWSIKTALEASIFHVLCVPVCGIISVGISVAGALNDDVGLASKSSHGYRSQRADFNSLKENA